MSVFAWNQFSTMLHAALFWSSKIKIAFIQQHGRESRHVGLNVSENKPTNLTEICQWFKLSKTDNIKFEPQSVASLNSPRALPHNNKWCTLNKTTYGLTHFCYKVYKKQTDVEAEKSSLSLKPLTETKITSKRHSLMTWTWCLKMMS